MIKRSLMFAGLMSASVGVPYVATQSDKMMTAASETFSSFGGGEKQQQNAAFQPVAQGEMQTAPRPRTAPLEGIPVRNDLAEVFRFDITPNWVYQRWARKSTSLADLEFYGVRVPLVTGTRLDDLAGSLTYYFNGNGGVERIVFRGTTGDTARLVNLVTKKYGLRAQTASHPGEILYQTRWNNKPQSQLRVRPTEVLDTQSPHASFLVELELQRPGSGRYLNQAREAQSPSMR